MSLRTPLHLTGEELLLISAGLMNTFPPGQAYDEETEQIFIDLETKLVEALEAVFPEAKAGAIANGFGFT